MYFSNVDVHVLRLGGGETLDVKEKNTKTQQFHSVIYSLETHTGDKKRNKPEMSALLYYRSINPASQ